MSTLVLISCSDKKKEGGVRIQPGNEFKPWIHNSELLRNLFNTRRKVFDLIKSNRLIDCEKRQGRRGDDPRNQKLVEGPDFGSSDNSGMYLPVCLRYSGRFFRTIKASASKEEAYDIWQRGNTSPVITLILSGLYGILSPFDYIQEYTCHFSDRIINSEESLKQIWQPIITKIILDIAEKESKIHIIDLLSEQAYQDVINWCNVYGKAECFHRAYIQKAGPETLLNSARFYLNEILNLDSDFSLPHDTFISRDYFDDPKERILFEPRRFSSNKTIAREGIEEVIPALKEFYGSTWDLLDEKTKYQIANSESSYLRNRDISKFDFTGSSIFLCKAIEIWLHSNVLKPLINIPGIPALLKYDRDHLIPPDKATLGNISYLLKEFFRKGRKDPFISINARNIFPNITSIHFLELSEDINFIADHYRNGWAHRDRMARDIFTDFRLYALDFFKKYAALFKA